MSIFFIVVISLDISSPVNQNICRQNINIAYFVYQLFQQND